MTIETYSDFDSLSCRAADIIAAAISENPEAHLCLATGASPVGAYRDISRRIAEGKLSAESLRITKLDEWRGIPSDHPGTCETFLRSEVIAPWGIKDENYLTFDGDTAVPEDEIRTLEAKLDRFPAFDICILGIGPNGHLGLNEPATELSVRPHLSTLAPTTRRHPMLGDTELEQGITMGLGAIMSSKLVLLLVVGESKGHAWKKLQDGFISTLCPATLLHLHPHVICLSGLKA